MKAIMLAAGVGARLYGDDGTQPPKCLLRFDGKSLMQRHLEGLQSLGLDSLTVVVGYRGEAIRAEAEAHSREGFLSVIHNPRFRNGPVVSLWEARDTLRSGDPVLFMDADVLYPLDMLSRLLESPHRNCFLFDEEFEDTDEPVRLCLRGGIPVEFGKNIQGDFERVGEWPGFLKLSSEMASKLADRLQSFMDRGQIDEPYEPAMRALVLNEPPGTFGIADITGTPWIEIDFPEDLTRAERDIVPGIRKTGA